MDVPLRLYIERLSDASRDTQKADDFIATYITTFASNQSLSSAVQQCYITAWDSDVFYAIGGATHAAVDFTLSVSLHEHVTQHL